MSKINYTLDRGENKMDASGKFAVNAMERLRRFLILGVEGGTFYTTEKELTKQNAQSIVRLIAENGKGVVQEIVNVSKENRAPKKDPSLFALALCATIGSESTRKDAYNAMQVVCNIPTHLFTFIQYCEMLSAPKTGWGRARRNAVATWYNRKSTQNLIYHTTKYKQRGGWSNRDMLRLAHVKPVDNDHNLVYKFLTSGALEYSPSEVADKDAFDYLAAVDEMSRAENAETVIRLIRDYKLVREHVPTQFLNNKGVWEALLVDMPIGAMVRNLGKMSEIGLLTDSSVATNHVVSSLSNIDAIKRAKLHPMNVLFALTTYNSGSGFRGKLGWKPVKSISQTLENRTFYGAFEAVEPAGTRNFVCVDVSGSMSWGGLANAPNLKPFQGAAAMAMVLARTERSCTVGAFDTGIKDVNLTPADTLAQAFAKLNPYNGGGTNCAAPMQEALRRKMEVDVFTVITDNETNSRTPPVKALNDYREAMGIDAKLITIGMTSGGFSIADPNDKGMLDIVGFDTTCPRIIRDFSAGAF